MYAIGNGESRAHLNIDKLHGTKIGCNAILREHVVDHLVCCDRRMVQEAVQAGYNNHSYIYTRSDWYKHFSHYPRIRELPKLPYIGNQRWDDPFHWGSGPYAVLLAAKLANKESVNLIGFDLYGNDNLVNNLYKDTKNYAAAQSRSVDPRYWIAQIAKVFELFKHHQFVIYQNPEWTLPQAWIKPNVEVDKISNIYYNT
jgi:hypothetical protein